MDTSSLTSINKSPKELFRKCFISKDRGKKVKSSKNTSTWIFYSKYNKNINKIIIELTISKISGNVILLINNEEYTDKLFIDKKLMPDINNGIKTNYKLKYLNHILNFIIDISLLKTYHKLFIDGIDFFSLKLYDDYVITSNNNDKSSDNSSDTPKDIVNNDTKKNIIKMDNIVIKPKDIIKMDNIVIKPKEMEKTDKKIDIYDTVFNKNEKLNNIEPTDNKKSIINSDTFDITDKIDKKTDIEKDLLLIFGPEKKIFNPFD